MIRTALIIAILVASMQANAVDEPYCNTIEEAARKMMILRQSGTTARDMLEDMGERKNPTLTRIIFSAFDEPRWHGDEHQRRAVKEFSNDWYLQCMRYVENS